MVSAVGGVGQVMYTVMMNVNLFIGLNIQCGVFDSDSGLLVGLLVGCNVVCVTVPVVCALLLLLRLCLKASGAQHNLTWLQG